MSNVNGYYAVDGLGSPPGSSPLDMILRPITQITSVLTPIAGALLPAAGTFLAIQAREKAAKDARKAAERFAQDAAAARDQEAMRLQLQARQLELQAAMVARGQTPAKGGNTLLYVGLGVGGVAILGTLAFAMTRGGRQNPKKRNKRRRNTRFATQDEIRRGY